ncbi:MAG: hypothetical protein ACIAXF_02940 [Phycisphaerales bacterium JB063]
MTRRTYILGILTLAATLFAGASPAMAARLVSVTVEAGQEQTTQSGQFRLSGQTRVELNFDATVQGQGNVEVHISQKLPSGQWQRLGTPFSTDRSQSGKREMTLHAGEYKIEIVATNANVSVTVDN